MTDPHDPYGKTIAMQRRALLQPSKPQDIIYYAALCLLDQQFEESEYWLDRCLELWPGNTEALYHKALIYLFNADYERGLPLYEHRFSCYEDHFKGPPLPRWEGQVTDKPLILWQEGGFGDIMMPARLLPEVTKRCSRVRLFCENSMLPLLRHSGLLDGLQFDDEAAAMVADGDAYQCSLMSLPFALGLTMDGIDGRPYLKVPGASMMEWREKLRGQSNIGFCWSGNPTWERDCTRSMPHAAAQELMQCIHVTPVVQQATGAKDWVDTAAVLKNCSVVLSTCTSIAHCAAGLGVPTWLLLSYDHDWRWGRSYATRTPWYNAIRIFRQPHHGEWSAVIGQVYEALKQELNAKPRAA